MNKLSLAILCLVSTLAAGAPAQTITVQPGDTLSAIAERELGASSAWRKLCEINEAILAGDCRRIVVGMVLHLSVQTPHAAASPGGQADAEIIRSPISGNEVVPEAITPITRPNLAPIAQPSPTRAEAVATTQTLDSTLPAPKGSPSTSLTESSAPEPQPAVTNSAPEEALEAVKDTALAGIDRAAGTEGILKPVDVTATSMVDKVPPTLPAPVTFEVLDLNFDTLAGYKAEAVENGVRLSGNRLQHEASERRGAQLWVPRGIERAANEARIRIAVTLSAPSNTTAQLRYITNEAGNSGWQDIEATPEGHTSIITYDVPAQTLWNRDIIGIRPDPYNTGQSITVNIITLHVVPASRGAN